MLRLGAKACEELDINAQTFLAYHKYHINKTMGISFVAFAFDDNMENGRDATTLAFLHTLSHKVAEKEVCKVV